jgi:hypothetical protein
MNRKVWLVMAGLAAGAGALVAQELTARQLFYKGDAEPAKPAAKAPAKKSAPKKTEAKAAPKVAAPAPTAPSTEVATPPSRPVQATSAAYVTSDRPLGLRYAVVQVKDGAESEVSPEATFHSGDFVRVKVEGNREGYLYVVARGSSGNWKPLFPAPDINGGDNKIAGHRGYRLPSDTQAFSFDEQAGEERLFVIFSAEPVKDIDELIPSLAQPAAAPKKELAPPGAMIMASARPMNDEFVSRLRNTYSRDLIGQTVAPGPAPAAAPAGPATLPENAVYVVNKSGGRVVADIRLEHK